MDDKDKLYKIMYKKKWLESYRMCGRYYYRLHDKAEDVEPMRETKARTARGLISEDNDINIEDLILVEV